MTLSDRGRDVLRGRALSFRYAFEGWRYALRTQHNTWIHAVVSMLVFALAFWLGISRLEWAVLVLTTTVVWMGEFANTALEVVVALVRPDYHPLAKAANDVAAATVLVGAIGAVIIGLLILGPPLWQRLFGG